jgi:hypothetical protein
MGGVERVSVLPRHERLTQSPVDIIVKEPTPHEHTQRLPCPLNIVFVPGHYQTNIVLRGVLFHVLLTVLRAVGTREIGTHSLHEEDEVTLLLRSPSVERLSVDDVPLSWSHVGRVTRFLAS